ncbi:hypothetical protein NFI96_025808 [Scomber scombrus]
MSLKRLRELRLWKTSCMVPVPKTPHSLTSHPSIDPPQFADQCGIKVDDAAIFLLHRALSHL